jgi:hypothetical protein
MARSRENFTFTALKKKFGGHGFQDDRVLETVVKR